MHARPLSLRSRDGRLAWPVPVALLALLALAYRPLLAFGLELPTHYQIEGWLFRPSTLPPQGIVALAAWLAWRRRARLRGSDAPGSLALAGLWLALSGAAFAWAHLTGAPDLLLPSLAATLLAFGAALRGWRGCAALALPAAVLVLGIRIPDPLQDEIVWRLQLGSTSAAAWLVNALGGALTYAGVILRSPEHAFQVIDGCSGFRGIVILCLVALLVRELFADAGPRMWLLLPLAPALGFALNVVRVAYVATSDNPEALAGMQGDHTPQGVAVLLAGTLALYGIGAALAAGSKPRNEPAPPAGAASAEPAVPAWLAAGWLALLVALSLTLSPFELPGLPRPTTALPEQGGGWVSEPLAGDPLFFGGGPQLLHRRYQPAAGAHAESEAIEILVTFEEEDNPDRTLLFTSKLAWPGPDWDVLRSEPAKIYALQRDAQLAVAVRPPSELHAVVYTWRPGSLGLWGETWRSLLALDASPLRREQPLTAVRLIAFAPGDGDRALERAKQRLDRFVSRFQAELAAL
jgi:exosortase